MDYQTSSPLRRPAGLVWAALAAVFFNFAQQTPTLGFLSILCCFCLFQLSHLPSARSAFYLGTLAGIGLYVPQMGFLSEIFGLAAVPLWLILPLWSGLFVLLIHSTRNLVGSIPAALFAPVAWTALEYFRSEVYWLRFSWFAMGYAWEPSQTILPSIGIYGAGFWTMALGVCLFVGFQSFRQRAWRVAIGSAGVGCLLAVFPWFIQKSSVEVPHTRLQVAAIQLEFPGEPQVLAGLDAALKAHPQTEFFALSEYTFDGVVPANVRKWCRKHGKWLLAGGREELTGSELSGHESASNTQPHQPLTLEGNATKAPFRNTAFVVAPSGEVTFTQVKSVPIQFFQDGLPALTQKVWESPWGRLGVAVCYDASYRRVMDVLVTQGAQALVVPAMDVEQWGRAQHELNARAMRVRCQEYGLPALRIASSGFSQLINPSGLEIARTSFPGQDEILAGELKIVGRGKIPLDRFLVLPAMVATTLIVVFLIGLNIRRSKWLSGTHTSTIS